ncbi:hypothetical protein [Luteimonas aquatica]|uniref:hypothetical protein n=1 Tax=Luteimonas aquatica TaxID=450364 RepID=UPI001F55CA1D|nr:hypothetical protein [Luteimonas aquatica]
MTRSAALPRSIHARKGLCALQRLRAFLAVEATAFALAALTHFGVIATGHAHLKAAIAESVIGTVLLGALAWSLLRPAHTRRAALLAQGFALFGTLVGVFTIVVGVGPRTAADVVFHVAIVLVLAKGWIVARRPHG